MYNRGLIEIIVLNAARIGFEAIESAVIIERSEGKAHFASEDFPEADERYKVAIRLLESTSDEMNVKEELLTALRLNRCVR